MLPLLQKESWFINGCLCGIHFLSGEGKQSKRANLLNERVCISLAVVQNTAFSGIPWKFLIKSLWNARNMMEYTTQMGIIAVKDRKNHITIDFMSPQRYGAVYLKNEKLWPFCRMFPDLPISEDKWCFCTWESGSCRVCTTESSEVILFPRWWHLLRKHEGRLQCGAFLFTLRREKCKSCSTEAV